DFYTLFSNPSSTLVSYWLDKGEKTTWSFIEMIRNRMMVEVELVEAVVKVRIDERGGSVQGSDYLERDLGMGRRSIH
ncbi:hypothetical protein HDV05_006584, partial [Chytridiales sp. JEL 0842]